MTNKHTIPFFDADELEDATLAATKVGHDHIIPMIEDKQRLHIIHTRLHWAGEQDSILHEVMVVALTEVESDLARAWSAPWN